MEPGHWFIIIYSLGRNFYPEEFTRETSYSSELIHFWQFLGLSSKLSDCWCRTLTTGMTPLEGFFPKTAISKHFNLGETHAMPPVWKTSFIILVCALTGSRSWDIQSISQEQYASLSQGAMLIYSHINSHTNNLASPVPQQTCRRKPETPEGAPCELTLWKMFNTQWSVCKNALSREVGLICGCIMRFTARQGNSR